jgi:ADP-heptose:LPS heptosyltransferase
VVCGRTVGEVSETIRKASVYIGNDSGITHLSALLGVPTVSIFGPTDPEIWRPLGRRVKVVRPDVSCSPCTEEMRNACPRPRCIESVSLDDVKRAAESLACIAQP